MLPSNTMNDLKQSGARYPKFGSQSVYGIGGYSAPDLFNIIFSQLAAPLVFTKRFSKSALHRCVNGVIFFSSNEKMRWITAWRIIAFVTRALFGEKQSSNRKFKSNSMRLFEFGIKTKGAISLLVFTSIPLPAFGFSSNGYSAPEPYVPIQWIIKSFSVCCSRFNQGVDIVHVTTIPTI